MANTTFFPAYSVASRLAALLAEIRTLRPDCAVELVPKEINLPKAVPVLSGQVPVQNGADFQVVMFYSRGRAIEDGNTGDRPSLISTHPMFNRIALR